MKKVLFYGQAGLQLFIGLSVAVIYVKNVETNDWSWLQRLEQIAKSG